MPDRLPPLVAAAKALAVTPRWVEHEGQYRLAVPLDIDGVTQAGLRLTGRCARDHPDQNVTFQIEYMFLGYRMGPVMRVDWRPVSPHQNKNLGPQKWRFMRLDGSHIHPFMENYDWMVRERVPVNEYMKLPIALPLDRQADDVSTLMTAMGEMFNIGGVEIIPAPPWEPRLL